MNRELFAEVSEVFLAARGVSEPERSSLLDERCGDRRELREAVERMLAEDGNRSDGFDDSAMVDGLNLDAFQGLLSANGSAHAARPVPELLPEKLGHFRIIRKLGEGGMGVVCEAEQDNPRRLVALKLLRTGLGSAGLARRFTLEAQVLARLHHPGIARVYEAGAAETPAGVQPYFAMELITGRPLLEHAESNTLSTHERLKLFLQICEAVEYAHRKGVIHRDLKPANIMVDEHGSPRILDFGVARITDADLQVSTMQTNPGQLVGTLPYMSPEQVSGNSDGVDTRTDVYALGIVLFQLLSGRLPYDTRSKSIPEAARIIRDQEPTRLGSVDTAFRGDLDTIVTRALDKDAARRYQSVAALATDIQRHLRHEPIEARPSSRLYQVGKFARRHPELVAGVAVALLAAAGGIVATSWGLVQANTERDNARRQATIAEDGERAASISARRAQRLSESLAELLAAAGPAEVGGGSESTVSMLMNAAKEIGGRLADDPEAELGFRIALTKTFRRVGEFAGALQSAKRAYELVLTSHDAESALGLEAAKRLAEAYTDVISTGAAFKDVQEEALRFTRSALAASRRVLGPRHATTVAILASAAFHEGYLDSWGQGVAAHKELIEVLDAVPPSERPCSKALALARYAGCLLRTGDVDAAKLSAQRSLELLDADINGPSIDAISGAMGIQDCLYCLGRLDEAIRVSRDGLATLESKYGRSHWSTISCRAMLAVYLSQRGDAKEALVLFRDNLTIKSTRWPNTASVRIWDIHPVAQLFARTGRREESASAYADLLDVFRANPSMTKIAQDGWREAELVVGLRTFDKWRSDALRLEVRLALDDLLATHRSRDLRLGGTDWSRFEVQLKRLGTTDPPTRATAETVRDLSDPVPGVYVMEFSVPVEGLTLEGSRHIVIAPWHIGRYSGQFSDLTHRENWTKRILTPPDDEIAAQSLTSRGWWEHGFGPWNNDCRFGLVADSTVEAPPGRYLVRLIADDGGRVLLDGQPIIECWPSQGEPRVWTAPVDLSPGPHQWHVEYVQHGGESHLRLSIEPVVAPE